MSTPHRKQTEASGVTSRRKALQVGIAESQGRTLRTAILVLVFLFACAAGVSAHETRPAYLEITETSGGRLSILWKSPTLGDPPVYLHPMLDDVALENLLGKCEQISGESSGSLSAATVCQGEIKPGSASLVGRRVAIDGLAGTSTDALVRLNFADGTSVTRVLKPADPSWTIAHDPGRGSSISAPGFFRMGVEHILFGIDHLLFVLLLLLIVENRWLLLKAVAAFTLAHTITLGTAVLGYVRIPVAPVEATIALSILFLASELAHHHMGADGLTYRAPWIVAGSFGLLHGFGFAGTLAGIGIPHPDIPRALFFFNLGVEAGQLAFILVMLSLIRAIRHFRISWPPWSVQIPAYAIGSIASLWFLQRCVPLF
jgi:hydrogenase/urease accessory protein HupE